MNRINHVFLIAAALAATISCTDYKEADVPNALEVDVTDLTFSPGEASRSVMVRSGSKWTVGSKPEWVSVSSISSAGDFQWNVSFTVTENDGYDREGVIGIGSGSGMADIKVYQQGKKGKYVAVESVSIDPSSMALTEDDTKQLTAVISPSNASIKTVTWKSLDPKYATVDENGVVTAVSAGMATISVTTDDGKKTANCHVTVKAKIIPVTGVSLDHTSLTLIEGESETLTATVAPENATDKSVTWKSSNTSVAAVSSSGVVTAKAAGVATITVTTNDGSKTAQCNVTVSVPVTGVSLNKTSLSMVVGETQTLTATVLPVDATDKSVTWSSSNTAVATVSASGVITAKAAGSATIMVTANDGGSTATCAVTVSVPVSGVSLDKTSLTLPVGDTQTLTATVSPSNASDKSVAWSSGNTSVATVSSTGVVTAKAAGTTTITVTTKDGGKTATCNVTVVIPVTGVSLDQMSLTMVAGDNRTLTATVSPSDATDKSVTWSSSNTSVATVSATGVVTAKAGGSATITVTTNDGGKTASCSVTVSVPVTGVSLNKTSLTLSEGDTQTLTATVSPTTATDKEVTWASDNETVATVTSSGAIVAKNAGTAVITVTTHDGAKTASCAVTVKPRVTGVSLDNTSISLTVGSTQTLTATVTPADALDKSVTWSSNNTSVATVSTYGVVTAKAAGTATITVRTNDGGKTATCTVTVTAISVTGVSLNKSSLTLYEGDSETLTATVSPTNATNKSVTWSTSNSSVASVTSSGRITALSAGSATITVTTSDGGKKATCSVTVKSDPHGAVDLGLSVKWSSYNYGASSVTAKGGYYMWGDPSGTAQPFEFSPPSVSSISGTQYDIVRQHWGGGWRIPTRAEINELYSYCSFTKTTVSGVSVLKVTGPSGASIYLPFTGYAMPDDGPIGTVQVSDSSNAYMMSAEASSSGMVYVYYFTPAGTRYSVSYNAAFVKFPIRSVK